jgi:hypothetical protein
MLQRSAIPAVLAVLWLAAAGASAALGAEVAYEVTVSARDVAYADTPVTVKLLAPAWARSAVMKVLAPAADASPQAAKQQRGARQQPVIVDIVPCDARIRAGKAEVTWLLTDLPKGTSRTYRLTFDKAKPVTASVFVRPHDDRIDLWVDGCMFTSYRFVGGPKPFCQPVYSIGGEPMTRGYPFYHVAGESTDHPHHRSLWFTHGDVNGVDFWSESPQAGRIVHRSMESGGSGRALGWLRARHDWLAPDGKKVCAGVLELRLYNVHRGRLLDFEYTVFATEGPVKFGDTKEGTMGLRLADSMTVKGGQGHILNSEGQRDNDTWGKRAAWCDYSGPVQGQPVGITIFDHPDNLRHPTYWHVRDYGLFAANPFGVHDFTGQPGEPGAYVLAQGEKLAFRYRMYVHDGAPDPAALATLYEQYSDPPQVSVRPGG